MIKTDTSKWPLVIQVVDGQLSSQQYQNSMIEWSAWLERNDPFFIFRDFITIESLLRPEGNAKEAKIWFQNNKDNIRKYVLGIATVVPAECFEYANKVNAEKLYGIPARTFPDRQEAQDWMMSLASQSQMTIEF